MLSSLLFAVASNLAGIVAAYPGELLSKRALTPRDIDPRTDCPSYLTEGEFEFPHYITQISKSDPDRAFGPQYFGVFTPNDVGSIFSFDIPASRSDANCTLEFLFPEQSQLKTSSYSISGGGSFFFTGYAPGSCPSDATTWNNQPKPGPFPAFPPVHMEPGHAYVIDIGPCFVGAGSCVAGLTTTNDTSFSFFQDYDECPIGIYTTYSYL
ncbi:GPI anchored cell wall protein [Grosmannia clavigera kw1407]|uniref:GPI anchored cell wall protein n=1 Tax=Grosmannia clavigera (strain kw1407 / UAMH 11150) TaxID=655863 RepID=F0XI92_GROCL|nr:GPI anchored cell wall protein [Grosmannia clavigera kw1407]EFX03314.1 GPI anchored cell wall protein [Grosmannia clavigera kw1407]